MKNSYECHINKINILQIHGCIKLHILKKVLLSTKNNIAKKLTKKHNSIYLRNKFKKKNQKAFLPSFFFFKILFILFKIKSRDFNFHLH